MRSARLLLFIGVLVLVPLAIVQIPRTVLDPTPTTAATAPSEAGSTVLRTAPPLATTDAQQDTISASRRTAIVRAAERVAPAVVSVNVLRTEVTRPRTLFEEFYLGPGGSRQVSGLGSGFIVDAKGLVLTNEHVVRGASQVVVTLADGRDFEARIVGTDDVTDLALLRITDAKATNLPAAPLGSSANLVIGEWVVAIGNPFGFLLSNAEPTVTAGVVSGIGRNIIPASRDSKGYYLDMIQTDASINPGNSGGPLVNALGQVIGVNSSIISETGGSVGLGFAIPIDRARRIAEALANEGRVRRVWVGLEVKASQPNQFGRSQTVEVAEVAPGSPAARAGLRAGETVVSVAGRQVHTPLDWESRLLDTRVGESIDIVVAAGDSRRTIKVGTQDLPSLTAERIRAGSDFEFITLTPAIRAERNLASEKGALIASLSPVARERLGLREGDLIVQINRSQITSAQEAAEMLRRATGGAAVRVVFERQGQYGQVAFYIG
jgi:serine protease Do